jgi:hypothetical protein
MIARPPPSPVDLITLAFSLALAKEGRAEDATRKTMDPIPEDEKPPAASAVVSTVDDLDDSLRNKDLAIQKLLKIAEDNKIIIDNHLRSAILGQDETYTSTDAAESIRRSSSSNISSQRRSSCSGSSLKRGGLISRSRRHLGSLFRMSSNSLESSSDKDTDSSVSIDSCVRTLPSLALEDSGSSIVGKHREDSTGRQLAICI